jgi:hypothetical protein
MLGPQIRGPRPAARAAACQFPRRTGIKAKLVKCFCDRDKAVVLGDVEFAWFASVDRKQGRMGRCVDVQEALVGAAHRAPFQVHIFDHNAAPRLQRKVTLLSWRPCSYAAGGREEVA